MRRLKQGLALGAVVALGLTACGSDDDDGDAEASGTLTIWADETRAEPIQALGQEWGDANGVQVDVVQITFGDLKDQYAQQAPAGQGPDILLGANDWAGEFVPSGLIAPIDLGDNRDNFNPAAVDAFVLDGQTYGLPVATENILLFRNTELAPEAPATINAMAESGLALQAEGKTQFPIGLQQGDQGDFYHMHPFFAAGGGYVFGGPDAEGAYDVSDVGIASEGGLVFAEALAGLGASGALKSTFAQGDLQAAWDAGQLPYWITGPWETTRVQESSFSWSAEGIPGWDGLDEPAAPLLGAQGFMLNQLSENQTTAQAFLEQTMTTEFMDALFAAEPRPPAWTESAEAASDDPIIAAVLEAGTEAYPNLPYPEMGIVLDEGGLQQKRILDGADPVTTTQEAQANIESRIGAVE